MDRVTAVNEKVFFRTLSMADQPSSTAALKSKKKGGGIKNFRDLIKRPKSANDSASSQLNSTLVSVSSEFDDHDLVPGKDAGNVESTASIPTDTFQSARLLSSSVPDLLGPTMSESELQYALSLRLKD